eukprot:PhM_4_TR3218/c0_g2_i1/m.79593
MPALLKQALRRFLQTRFNTKPKTPCPTRIVCFLKDAATLHPTDRDIFAFVDGSLDRTCGVREATLQLCATLDTRRHGLWLDAARSPEFPSVLDDIYNQVHERFSLAGAVAFTLLELRTASSSYSSQWHQLVSDVVSNYGNIMGGNYNLMALEGNSPREKSVNLASGIVHYFVKRAIGHGQVGIDTALRLLRQLIVTSYQTAKQHRHNNNKIKAIHEALCENILTMYLLGERRYRQSWRLLSEVELASAFRQQLASVSSRALALDIPCPPPDAREYYLEAFVIYTNTCLSREDRARLQEASLAVLGLCILASAVPHVYARAYSRIAAADADDGEGGGGGTPVKFLSRKSGSAVFNSQENNDNDNNNPSAIKTMLSIIDPGAFECYSEDLLQAMEKCTAAERRFRGIVCAHHVSAVETLLPKQKYEEFERNVMEAAAAGSGGEAEQLRSVQIAKGELQAMYSDLKSLEGKLNPSGLGVRHTQLAHVQNQFL